MLKTLSTFFLAATCVIAGYAQKPAPVKPQPAKAGAAKSGVKPKPAGTSTAKKPVAGKFKITCLV